METPRWSVKVVRYYYFYFIHVHGASSPRTFSPSRSSRLVVPRSLLLFNLKFQQARCEARGGRIVNRFIERNGQQRACRCYVTIKRYVYTRPLGGAELDCKQTRSSLARRDRKSLEVAQCQ